MPCVQNYDYQIYYHITVIPACIFLVLHHTLDYWCTKKFHLIPPIQYLIDNDCKRSYYIFTFGALSNVFIRHLGTEQIITIKEGDLWYLKPLLSVLLLIEIGFIYYPIFACFCSRYVLFSRSYGFMHMSFLMTQDIFQILKQSCQERVVPGVSIAIASPGLMCSFVVLLYFLKDLFFSIKSKVFIERSNKDIINSRQINYVKKLLRKKEDYTSCNRHLSLIPKQLRKFIWKNDPSFRYSSVLLGALLIIYQWYFLILCVAFYSIKVQTLIPPTSLLKKYYIVFIRILSASYFITVILCIGQTVRLLICHRANMLKMYKGKANLEEYSDSGDTVTNIILLPYHRISVRGVLQPYVYFLGYFIAFNVIGSIILSVIVTVFVSLLYLMAQSEQGFVFSMKLLYKSLFVSVIFVILQFILVKFVFSEKQEEKAKEHNSYWIKNLKLYHVLIYFTLFGNLIIGFFSSLLTTGLVALIQMASLGRLDYSVLNTKYFLRIDRGYNSYLGFLKIQSMYTNPSVKCFCQILLESNTNYVRQKFQYNGPRFSMRARNRWHLAVMLIKEESLRQYRRKISSKMFKEIDIQYSQFTSEKSAILEA